MKITFSIWVLVSVALLSFSGKGQQTRIVNINGKYGLVRPFYPNIVVEPIYENIVGISPNRFIITYKRKHGLIDSTGKEVIKPTYGWYEEALKEKLPGTRFYKFSNESSSFIVNHLGEQFPSDYEIIAINGDLMIVEVTFKDSVQKKSFFSPGDREEIKTGILHKSGNWIVKPEYRGYEFVTNHCIKVTEPPREQGVYKRWLINRKGEMLVGDTLIQISNGSYLHDSLSKHVFLWSDLYFWHLDSTGKIIKKEKRDAPELNVVKNKEKGKYGCLQNNAWIIPANYDKINVYEKYAFAYDKTKNNTDVYDRKGKLVATTGLTDIRAFIKNDKNEAEYFYAAKNGSVVLVGTDFTAASTPVKHFFERVLFSRNDTALFVFRNEKSGVMDKQGRIIIPEKYYDEAWCDGRLIRVRKIPPDQYDLYDLSGKKLATDLKIVNSCSINPNIYYANKTTVCSIVPSSTLVAAGKYDRFREIPENKLVIAYKGDKGFILDKKFRLLNPSPVNDVYTRNKETLLCILYNGKRCYIGNDAKPITPEYDQLSYLCGNGKNEKWYFHEGNKYGVIDYTGKLILKPEWDSVFALRDVVVFKKEKRYFFTDTNLVFDPQWSGDEFYSHHYGKQQFFYRDKGVWTLLKNRSIQFEQLGKCPDTACYVKQNGRWGLYDPQLNTWLLRPKYYSTLTKITNTNNHITHYLVIKDSTRKHFIEPKTGSVTAQGYEMVDPIFAMIDAPSQINGNFLVNAGGTVTWQNYREKVTGGKYGILGENYQLLHSLDGDYVVPLINKDYKNWNPHVLGFLWNKGGRLHEFLSERQDSIFVEDYELGHMEISPPVYDKQIIGGKFGIVGPDGKEILPVIYDEIVFKVECGEGYSICRRSFSDSVMYRKDAGIALYPITLRQGTKWGLADLSGKILYPTEYDSITEQVIYEEPCFTLWKGGTYQYGDNKGKLILPDKFTGELVYYTNDDKSLIIFQKDGINTPYEYEDEVALPVQFDEFGMEITHFDENGNIITTSLEKRRHYQLTGGKFGVLDPATVKWKLEPTMNDIKFAATLPGDSGKRYRRDVSVTEKLHSSRTDFAGNNIILQYKIGEKWGLFDFDKGHLSGAVYDSIRSFSEQDRTVFKVCEQKKCGCMNSKGETILQLNYQNVEPAFILNTDDSLRLQYIVRTDNFYGVLDEKGAEVIKPVYDKILKNEDARYTAWKDGKTQLLDDKGQAVSE